MPKLNSKINMSILLCFTYAVLSGCGTKGPLYIPEQRYPQKDTSHETPKAKSQAAPEVSPPSKTY